MSGKAPEEGGLERLERAVRALLENDVSDGGAELLRRHEDLRDLLEPMLAPEREGAEAPEALPRRLGDFELVRELGRGGMGVVYEARQLSLGRRVALKVLGAHLTLSAASIARFKREALTAAKLRHPSIVRVLVVGEEAGHHFFAMELVEGAPLDRLLDQARERPAAERSGAVGGAALAPMGEPHPFFARGFTAVAVDLVAQVAEALAQAHAQGVLHRDLKPSNILVRRDGTAVLTDFGLARAGELPSLTRTGALGGTPHYTAPEQAAGATVDERSDVFSLGVTLYELLTLQRPFDGESAAAILQRIQTLDPPEPQKLEAFIPTDLSAVVMKAIEKEPERRYAGTAAFAEDLRAFLAYRPVSARRVSGLARARRWARREPLKAALLGGLLVISGGLAGLSGYLVAKGKEIAAGKEQLRQEEIDRLLDEGFAELQGGTPEWTVAVFEDVLRRAPGHPEAVAGLVQSFTRRRKWDDALALLDRHAATVARHPGFRLLRAECLRRLDRGAEAERLERDMPAPGTAIDLHLAGLWENELGLLRVPGAYERALGHLSLAIRLSPAPQRTLYAAWAIAVSHAGDAAARRECADTIERLWPDRPYLWAFIPEVLHAADPERARSWLAKEPSLQVRPTAILRRLGTAYATLGENEAALRVFREWLGQAPHSGDAWYNLGVVLHDMGRGPEGRDAFRKAVELSPDLVEAHYNLGNSLHGEGKHAEAVASYREALRLEPRFADAWTNLGLALHHSGDHSAGMEALRKALEIVPAHPNAHWNLQFLAYRAKDYAATKAERERWARLHPGDSEAQRELAEVLVSTSIPESLREPERGLELALRAVRLARGRIDGGLRTLAMAQSAVGDHESAIATAELAYRLVPPDDPGAEAMKAKLRKDLEWIRETARSKSR